MKPKKLDPLEKNVAIVTPTKPAAGYRSPDVSILIDNIGGGGTVTPSILAQGSLVDNARYRVEFNVDTISNISSYDYSLKFATSEINVYNLSSNKLVYSETPSNFISSNLLYNDSLSYWYINDESVITTDVLKEFN